MEIGTVICFQNLPSLKLAGKPAETKNEVSQKTISTNVDNSLQSTAQVSARIPNEFRFTSCFASETAYFTRRDSKK